MLETEIDTATGVWTVRIKDGRCSIIDAEGRERGRFRDHEMTAVHLAMAMATRPFTSSPNADEALRLAAKNFTEKTK